MAEVDGSAAGHSLAGEGTATSQSLRSCSRSLSSFVSDLVESIRGARTTLRLFSRKEVCTTKSETMMIYAHRGAMEKSLARDTTLLGGC